jgi:hypothetical protein
MRAKMMYYKELAGQKQNVKILSGKKKFPRLANGSTTRRGSAVSRNRNRDKNCYYFLIGYAVYQQERTVSPVN